MRAEILVDSGEFWTRLRTDLRDARSYTYLQTFSFEGDSVGLALGDELLRCGAPDRRVLVDSFTRIIQNDRLIHGPRGLLDPALRAEVRMTRRLIRDLRAAGVGLRFTNPLGVGFLRVFHRNHKKLALIDDRVAYVGGINFCEHNFQWHDVMFRIEAPEVAAFLRDDFLASWTGRPLCRAFELPGLEIHTLSGRGNPAAFRRVFEAFRRARRSITVVSPYLSPPFTGPLRAARARGVQVRILSPAENNRLFLKRFITSEANRAGFDLHFYPGRMNHTKGALVDDHTLIAGSSNFDGLSYRLLSEIVLITTLPELVAGFRTRVLEPDLAVSSRHRRTSRTSRGGLRRLSTRLLSGLTAVLSPI